MSDFNWHRIRVTPFANSTYNIEFEDGTKLIFDLNPYFKEGSVFLTLKNYDIFNKVKISSDGRSIEFPENLDFCADSLWLKAIPQLSDPYS